MKLSPFAACAFMCCTLFTPAVRAGQVNAGAEVPNGGAALASGTTVKAVLAKPVDSRTVKVGDAVYAMAAEDVKEHGRVVVTKGSRVVGHVTEVAADGNGVGSASVGLLFDHAVSGDGREVAMHSVVQALAAGKAGEPTSSRAAAAGADVVEDVRGEAGVVSGSEALAEADNELTRLAADPAGRTGAAVNSTARAGAGVRADAGRRVSLYPASTGVAGLKGVSLATNAGPAEGSIVSSKGNRVHLESGTQMVLRVAE